MSFLVCVHIFGITTILILFLMLLLHLNLEWLLESKFQVSRAERSSSSGISCHLSVALCSRARKLVPELVS
jgi:hypothetical protein